MTNGSGGPGLPDLETPPQSKEALAGGPPFPVDAGISEDDKDETVTAAGTTIQFIGAGIILVGGAATVVAPPAAVPAGVLGGAIVLMGEILQHIGGDPPKPYERVVTFERRESRIPPTSDRALQSLGVATQYSIATAVTGQGYLDALERLGGAQQAEDLDWAVTHKGVVLQCRKAFAIDLAGTAAALLAVARALQDSTYDLSPTGQDGTALSNWLNKRENRAAMEHGLKEAGFLPPEIKRSFDTLKNSPGYKGSAATLSEELDRSSRKLYTSAEKLYAD